MKVRPWLSILIPPALLALVFWWPHRVNYSSPYLFVANTPDLLTQVCLGLALGLIIPLICLADGNKTPQINGSAFVAGVVVLSVLAIAAIACDMVIPEQKFNSDVYAILAFSITPQALAVFGGLLLTGSISFRNSGKLLSMSWKHFLMLLITPLVVYTINASLSLYLLINAKPLFVPKSLLFLVISVVRSGLASVYMILLPMVLPEYCRNKRVKLIMAGYGIMLFFVALVLQVGGIMWFIKISSNISDAIPVPDNSNFFIAPMTWIMRAYPNLFNAVFALAGLCLKLGFSKDIAKPIASC